VGASARGVPGAGEHVRDGACTLGDMVT